MSKAFFSRTLFHDPTKLVMKDESNIGGKNYLHIYEAHSFRKDFIGWIIFNLIGYDR